MPISICTLFEKNYHYGLAILVNSLERAGFEGDIFAGYRGALPFWAKHLTIAKDALQQDIRIMQISKSIRLHFILLNTDAHFTNFKPQFMLELFEGLASESKGLFYFDPDIVLNAKWRYFLEWIECGIALCEDVNSPIFSHHPIRVGWRKIFSTQTVRSTDIYVNAGSVGVMAKDKEFLSLWKAILEESYVVSGGAHQVGIGKEASSHLQKGFGNCLTQPDQDCLNAAIERSTCDSFSILNRTAMAFDSGDSKLPHSIGGWKPWGKNYLLKALEGTPPRFVDKVYWSNADGPIHCFSPLKLWATRLSIKGAAFIGRFYKRS